MFLLVADKSCIKPSFLTKESILSFQSFCTPARGASSLQLFDLPFDTVFERFAARELWSYGAMEEVSSKHWYEHYPHRTENAARNIDIVEVHAK